MIEQFTRVSDRYDVRRFLLLDGRARAVRQQFLFDRTERVYRSAEMSECGKYRYWLDRRWHTKADYPRRVCFVMLNPSTADALEDDPTIRRCMGFAQAWGCNWLTVRNLFAWRSTEPKGLLTAEDPVGPLGDANLIAAKSADLVVVAWGAWVPFERHVKALELLAGKQLHCLGITKGGKPRHPLYCRADARPVPFPVEGT